jgi:hypothetical protein
MSETAELPHDAPPLAANNLDDVLADADWALAAMAIGSPPAIAELAGDLVLQARRAGVLVVAEAAEAIRQAACGDDNLVSLAQPIQRLADAIADEQRRHDSRTAA